MDGSFGPKGYKGIMGEPVYGIKGIKVGLST